jgi:simple sugar transport system substrate-binding protein
VSDQDHAEIEEELAEEERGLSRRDVLLGGGLLMAGAGLMGAPVAAAATSRASATWKYAVITHGAGDLFWVVVHNGVNAAAKKLGVSATYSESFNDPQKQSQLIDTAVAQKPNGIAVSAPNPSAIADSLKRAAQANIPIITLNSGETDFQKLGAITHVGQDEIVAGQGAGKRFKTEGVKNLLILVHEQGNIGLEQRFNGAKSTFGGTVTRLQVTGVKDLATTQNEIRSKLQADKSIDSVLGLNPQVGFTAFQAAKSVSSSAKVATFDLSTDVLKAIAAGQMLFAVDQQQYLQGYLPIVFLFLNNTNANTVGGGKPVLTGPGFVEKGNATQVIKLAAKGTR